jgi:hypothetical protein
MKKFRVEVTLTSEYEIEIDDDLLGDDFLAHFHRYFADFETWEEHARYIATQKARGFDFIEGYGAPLVNGKKCPFQSEDETQKAINICPVFENDVDTDCSEY